MLDELGMGPRRGRDVVIGEKGRGRDAEVFGADVGVERKGARKARGAGGGVDPQGLQAVWALLARKHHVRQLSGRRAVVSDARGELQRKLHHIFHFQRIQRLAVGGANGVANLARDLFNRSRRQRPQGSAVELGNGSVDAECGRVQIRDDKQVEIGVRPPLHQGDGQPQQSLTKRRQPLEQLLFSEPSITYLNVLGRLQDILHVWAQSRVASEKIAKVVQMGNGVEQGPIVFGQNGGVERSHGDSDKTPRPGDNVVFDVLRESGIVPPRMHRRCHLLPVSGHHPRVGSRSTHGGYTRHK